ncbi:MFS transporter [Mycobacterium sp. C31M]
MSLKDRFKSAPDAEGEADAAAAPGLTAVLDRIGFGRVQAALILLLMAGLFFDSLEQNSTGAMGPLLKETFGIGNAELTMINTVTVVGGLVGRLIGGYLADKYGRRFALSLNLLVYTLGGLISAVAINYEMLLASRFIVGIGLGGEFTVGLAILSEIMATRYRGSMTATLNLASGGFGNLVSFGFFWLVLGPLNDSLGGNDTSWRWTYVMLALPAVLVVYFRRYLPESPRFLLSKGRIEEANQSLTRLASGSVAGLRNPGPTKQFVTGDDIPLQTKSSYAEVFKGRNLRRTIAVGAASWMSFGAQVTLLFLMPILLVSRGYSLSDSLAYTMFMHIGSVFGALTASLLAGKVKRRTAVGGAAICGCAAAISFAVFADSALKIVILGMIFKYFTMMTNTLLSVWSPELFPTSVRAMGTSVVNGIGNVAGAVMPFAALFFFDRFGVPGVFFMIAVMYVLLFVASRFGPETLGKSLEEVSEQPRVLAPA